MTLRIVTIEDKSYKILNSVYKITSDEDDDGYCDILMLLLKDLKNKCWTSNSLIYCGAPNIIYGEYGRSVNLCSDAAISSMVVSHNNVCVSFKDFKVNERYGIDDDKIRNPNIYSLEARVKVFGPMGYAIASKIKLNETVNFSYRGVSEKKVIGGEEHENIKITTFDYVLK